jgi:hypothetical protein
LTTRPLLLSLPLLFGCSTGPVDGFSFTGAGDPSSGPDAVDDDPADAPDRPVEGPSGDACHIAPPTAPLDLVMSAAPGAAWWSCSVPAWDEPECTCVEGYVGLGARHPEVGEPITAAALEAQLRAIDPDLDGQGLNEALLRPDPGDAGVLAGEVLGAMGGCWLRRVADSEALFVDVVGTSAAPGFTARDLIFEDDIVGDFGAILLTPLAAAPGGPGVVVLPGHGEDAQAWIDRHHGERYPQAGISMLILTSRGMCVDEAEDEASRAALRAGTSVLALRMYESVRALRFLQALPEVGFDRVGLMGHSTGSIASNAIARTDAGFAALVTDLTGTYYNYISRPLFADAMAPRVYPWHVVIADISTAGIPAIEVGYGYGVENEDDPQQPNALPEIFDFLETALAGANDGP